MGPKLPEQRLEVKAERADSSNKDMRDLSTLRFRALLLAVVVVAGACSVGRTDPDGNPMEITLIDGSGTLRGEE